MHHTNKLSDREKMSNESVSACALFTKMAARLGQKIFFAFFSYSTKNRYVCQIMNKKRFADCNLPLSE